MEEKKKSNFIKNYKPQIKIFIAFGLLSIVLVFLYYGLHYVAGPSILRMSK